MLAAQLRARGVGDASTLGPGEGAIRLPWEESGGEVRKGEEGCPGTGWHVGAATCGADAGTCQRLSLQRLVLLFSAKCLVIPTAIVDRGKQLRAERISGFDV